MCCEPLVDVEAGGEHCEDGKVGVGDALLKVALLEVLAILLLRRWRRRVLVLPTPLPETQTHTRFSALASGTYTLYIVHTLHVMLTVFLD